MELEYFVRPGDEDRAHEEWLDARFAWWQTYGLDAGRLRLRPHGAEELSH